MDRNEKINCYKRKTVSCHVAAQPIRDKQGNITGVSTCASECVGEKPFTV